MRFLLDENVDRRLAVHLTSLGHDVKAVARDFPSALRDREVLSLALRERRILITNDRDFGELIVREGRPHSGVILLRLTRTSLAVVQERLDFVLAHHEARLPDFLTVTDARVRVR